MNFLWASAMALLCTQLLYSVASEQTIRIQDVDAYAAQCVVPIGVLRDLLEPQQQSSHLAKRSYGSCGEPCVDAVGQCQQSCNGNLFNSDPDSCCFCMPAVVLCSG